MAVGLNYYLKYYCHTTVSWFVDDKFEMPDSLPVIEKPLTIDARCKDRFFLNYCTFGYTMPWWSWRDWEHFIDWMALNGINLPLAITGQESIWHKVWMKLGLSDKEIRHYFTGPAHLPWHRMLNIDYWQGDLPMQIIGDVKGKNVVLVDDIVDTAGTITLAANLMMENGAQSVRAIASHCVMSDPASYRIQESCLTEMVFTDSIPYTKKCSKVKQLSIADMFAETIRRVVNNESISSQYLI